MIAADGLGDVMEATNDCRDITVDVVLYTEVHITVGSHRTSYVSC